MADTLPDVSISKDEYVDIYTATGLAVGTAIEILNKSSTYMYVQIAATQPDADSKDGIMITPIQEPWAVASIESGSSGVWVRAAGATLGGRVSVVDLS